MMRYIRFMGEREFEKYLAGEQLENTTEWRKKANRTESVGFCFFDDVERPEKRMEYLTGVVDMEIVAVFEPIGDVWFKESEGMYRDPEQDIPIDILEALFSPVIMMPVKEYSLTQYSQENLRLVDYGRPCVTKECRHCIDWNKAGD